MDVAGVQTEQAGGVAPRWLRAVFYANLVAQTAIVVTGGLVRVTGSGLGCPTWPECTEGSLTPTDSQVEAWHKYVEFGNRTLTFVLGVLAIVALVGAIAWGRRLRAQQLPSRRPVVMLAAVPLVGTFAQAVLGGITVLTGLNPVTVALHFLLSARASSMKPRYYRPVRSYRPFPKQEGASWLCLRQVSSLFRS